QLLRHLIGDSTAQAVAAQMIRAMRLDAADFVHIKRRHLLDRCQAWTFAVEALGLQAIERLIGAEMSRKVAIDQHISAAAVDAEKRRPRAVGLNRYQRGPVRRSSVSLQNLRQLRDRLSLKEDGERKFALKFFRDLREQAHRQDRSATELKVVLIQTNRAGAEQAFPDFLQFSLGR